MALHPSSPALQTHVDAFLLAVASSTDNFMVGVSAGLSSPPLSHFYKVNLAVALCNAGGTLLATYGGDHLKRLPEVALMKLAAAVSTSSSPEAYKINFSIPALLAAMAFAYLSWKEYSIEELDDADDKITKQSSLSYSIALPMTLNNLAGGVAGGVLGLSVLQATIYAFFVSLGSMTFGHFLGDRFAMMQQSNGNLQEKKISTNQWCKYISVVIYLVLCFQSLAEV